MRSKTSLFGVFGVKRAKIRLHTPYITQSIGPYTLFTDLTHSPDPPESPKMTLFDPPGGAPPRIPKMTQNGPKTPFFPPRGPGGGGGNFPGNFPRGGVQIRSGNFRKKPKKQSFSATPRFPQKLHRSWYSNKCIFRLRWTSPFFRKKCGKMPDFPPRAGFWSLPQGNLDRKIHFGRLPPTNSKLANLFPYSRNSTIGVSRSKQTLHCVSSVW